MISQVWLLACETAVEKWSSTSTEASTCYFKNSGFISHQTANNTLDNNFTSFFHNSSLRLHSLKFSSASQMPRRPSEPDRTTELFTQR